MDQRQKETPQKQLEKVAIAVKPSPASTTDGPRKRGRPPKNTPDTKGATTAEWTTPQVEMLLRLRYDTHVADFLKAKNKDKVAKGWKQVQMLLNFDADVEYSVEQCKNKVSALKALWNKIRSEENETGNVEKCTKKPEFFESMVLHFSNKSGLRGDTLGNAASESAVTSNEATKMVLAVQRDNISTYSSASINTIASTAVLNASNIGNNFNLDSEPDDDEDSAPATNSLSKNAGIEPKHQRKWQKLDEEEMAGKLTAENLGLGVVAENKVAKQKQQATDDGNQQTQPAKQTKPDVPQALQGIGKDMANGMVEMGQALAGAISGSATMSNQQSDQLQSLVLSQEGTTQQLAAIVNGQRDIVDGQREIVEASNRVSSLLASLQDKNSKQLAEMVDASNRVSNLLEQFLLRSMQK
ncbi:hypothetical protein HDU78_006053 [Chytriomyces hyalinus]|nr:hypothetical protein HDU78_006053 [Chytriomyces hyalinus]